MMDNRFVSQTRQLLIDAVRKTVTESQVHSLAFALRICGTNLIQETGLEDVLSQMTGDAVYGGYPEVAGLGYKIALTNNDEKLLDTFLDGVRRQRSRSLKALDALSLDDIALLGFAEGLLVAKKANHTLEVDDLQQWLFDLINLEPKRKIWTSRLRDLAGDLLDGKGRLHSLPDWTDNNAASLEIVLKDTWHEYQTSSDFLTIDFYQDLLSRLIKHANSKISQVEEIMIWLKALDLLIEQNSKFLFPKTDTAISMLADVKKRIDLSALRNARLSLLIGSFVIVVINVVYFLAREQLAVKFQNRLDIILPVISVLAGYIYAAFTQKEMNPKEIFLQIFEKHKLKSYKKWGFDIEKFNKL